MSSNDEKKCKVNRDELLLELSECREDERNCKDQMVQVVGTVSTILGVLFGSTYFSFDNKSDKMTVLYFSKVVFYLSIAAFCIAFTYIIVLGIGSTLRYYYVQKIEDLLLEENKNSDFLHWGSYFAPIATRNRKHLYSMHTLLYYMCYTFAAISAVVFSIGTIIMQYIRLKNKTEIDNLIFVFAIVGVIGTVLIFYRTTARAKNMALYAEKMALFNRKKRLSLESSLNSYRAFRHYIKYFIYPKLQDLEKPLFVTAIFLLFSYMEKGLQLGAWNWKEFFVSILVFEVLAYQARYQINDLRDIEEDKDSNDRLFPKGVERSAYIIEISAILAGIKIILAFACTYFLGGEIRSYLYIELVVLAIMTVIYERVRDTYNLNKICFWVGMGYPLRFMVAIMAANPERFNIANIKLYLFYILIMAALWALGSMASVSQWVADVTKLKDLSVSEYGKKHYKKLAESIAERYNCAKEKKISEQVNPLRERGNVGDIWNVYFIFSFCCLEVNAFLQKPVLEKYMVVGAFLTLAFLLILVKLASYKKIIYCDVALAAIIFMKLIFAGQSKFKMGCIIYVFQLIILGTYFYVTYRPEPPKINVKEMLMYLMKLVLGKAAFDCIIKPELFMSK